MSCFSCELTLYLGSTGINLSLIGPQLSRPLADVEHVLNVFIFLCKHEGIVYEVIPSYTPQQNRVSKRKNMIIMNMAISMLMSKYFLKEL